MAKNNAGEGHVTKTLSQLVLKEYFRSLTGPDSFEQVHFGDLSSFLESTSAGTDGWTDLGIWISPLDVDVLMETCRDAIAAIAKDNEEYNHLRVACTIATLARWTELGAEIASVPKEREIDEHDAPVYARAAEILGAFSAEFLPYLRKTVEFGAREGFNKQLSSAAGLLVRQGTDEDLSRIMRVIAEASPVAGYPMLYQYCTAGLEVDNEFVTEQFERLQDQGFPELTQRNVNLFCELATRSGVPINFEELEESGDFDWVEEILHRMLCDPKRFEAQRDALYKVLPEIHDNEDCGSLAGVVFARIGGTGEGLQDVFGEAFMWEVPAVAYLALVDMFPPEYFAECATSETDPDRFLVLRFLESQCSPKTSHLDLAVVHLAFREPVLGSILLYDPRLRASRDTFLGVFQTAVAGHMVTDAECAMILGIAERLDLKEHLIGGGVSFGDHRVEISDRVGGDLARAVLEYGGPQTRALLLHWVFLWGSDKQTRDTLLVWIAYLGSPESWIESILRRFYGVDQNDVAPWLDGDAALVIEGVHNTPHTDLEGIATAMHETEMYRRPGLISRLWEAPHSTLWKRAWRLASARPGFHPLLSPPNDVGADDTAGSGPLSPVSIVSRFVTGDNCESLQPVLEEFLEMIKPEPGWPTPIRTLISAETGVVLRLPVSRIDVVKLTWAEQGDILTHARILSIMSLEQPGATLDDQALVPPERVDKEDGGVVYASRVDGWAITYRVRGDAAPCVLTMTYGPVEQIFHIDESRRIVRKHSFTSYFDIEEPEDLTLLRHFHHRVAGVVLSKRGLRVYINENYLLEAGVHYFGNAGDITGLNAFYDYCGTETPFFFKGWIVWGALVPVRDDTGGETFQWRPDDGMNEHIDDAEAEEIIERFGEFTDAEYIDTKRRFVLKDEEQVRIDFQRWGVLCDRII